MKEVCEFNCRERCTWMGDSCKYPGKECFAIVRKGIDVVIPKMTVMQPTVINVSNEVGPSENVALEEILCKSGNPVKYRDCPDYNTEFCRGECEFGTKEKKVEDVNLDYSREDGK